MPLWLFDAFAITTARRFTPKVTSRFGSAQRSQHREISVGYLAGQRAHRHQLTDQRLDPAGVPRRLQIVTAPFDTDDAYAA